MCESRCGKDGRDEEGRFVADAAGGVLVDGESVERCGVEGVAGVTHRLRERCKLLRVKAPLKDGHEEAGDLCVSDELALRCALDYCSDEGFDFGVSKSDAVAFVEDDIDWMDGIGHLSRENAAGKSSVIVA